MSTINETLAQHEAQIRAAAQEKEQQDAQVLAELTARREVAESAAFKVVAERAEELATKAMRVTTTSGDISKILKAQGEIQALTELVKFYTFAEEELRTTRQEDD